ncbi:hypothetical protein PLESTB_000965900 [Pleodorina starrii]|uniref:Glycosyl transferase CAP10 domain-containing protein n=1 Tax=Pleodorina starrii TaxID=330485 RepID=A0A9W6BNB3_9CHLO|nr:hypothetical protein PLESTB_000965900 [Pleodorina starrii]GLC70978.1 hypothetical protein PLESTF_001057100 [Pleodorina starrii]
MHYGFVGGKAYVLSPRFPTKYGQVFMSRHLAYMDVLLDLERRFGHLIPDVEFVIVTTETPNEMPSLPRNATGGDQAQSPPPPPLPPHLEHPFGQPGLPHGAFPVFRVAKSDAFPANVLIPSHDFYVLRYDSTVLNGSARLVEEAPWASRLPSAFAEYDMHVPRSRHPQDPYTYRRGVDGIPICGGPRGDSICFVRRHFQGIAHAASASSRSPSSPSSPVLDIRQIPPGPPGSEHVQLIDQHTPRHVALATAAAAAAAAKQYGSNGGSGSVSANGTQLVAQEAQLAYLHALMSEGGNGGGGGIVPYDEALRAAAAASTALPSYLAAAARHKVLVHLDGRGLSSSLERLLALGSVVLAEQSGYYGYFHRALKPYEHYLPWWEKEPGDVFSRLQWVRDNADAASRIAAAGAAFAREHLTETGRACYWLRLLQRHAAALRVAPALHRFPHATPLGAFRQTVIGMQPLRGQRSLFGQPFEP